MCHIASSSCGFALLPPDICNVLVNIAENSPLLSLRGTCLYAMSLLAMSHKAASKLLSVGWHCASNAGDR